MPATMKSIARDLGVSVSKVLHNHTDISRETRNRVLRRMKEENYQPNLSARALSTGRTGLVGLIVPDFVHPFFAQVAKGISGRLSSQGYSLVIASSEEDPQLERREIDQMISRRVDALLLASTENHPASLQKLKQQSVPFILLDRKIPGFAANFVGIDDVLVGEQATSHLMETGCKIVAHIVGSEVSTAHGRRIGYERALAKRGVVLPSAYIVKNGRGDDLGETTGYLGMKKLLELKPRTDGVFCCNDPIAMGAIRAIFEAGLRIPGDIAVIGCGNAHHNDLLRVPLSSVDQNTDALGENAAKLVLSIIKRKNGADPKTVLVDSKLVIRASTQR